MIRRGLETWKLLVQVCISGFRHVSSANAPLGRPIAGLTNFRLGNLVTRLSAERRFGDTLEAENGVSLTVSTGPADCSSTPPPPPPSLSHPTLGHPFFHTGKALEVEVS